MGKQTINFLIWIIAISITIFLGGFQNALAKSHKHIDLKEAKEAVRMMYDLCDIAGYGFYSGVHPGPKADKAAGYILKKLKRAGLRNAHLETVQVNDPFPDFFEMTVTVEGGEQNRPIEGFPLSWTVGTSQEGIVGELAYVGDGSPSNFEIVDVSGKIALIDHKHFRHTSTASGSNGAVVRAKDKGAIAVILAELQVDGPKIKWQPGTPNNLFPIQGYSVGKSEGAYLRELAMSNKNHEVRYILSVPHKVVDCYNVVAKLPGNGSMDENILVGT